VQTKHYFVVMWLAQLYMAILFPLLDAVPLNLHRYWAR